MTWLSQQKQNSTYLRIDLPCLTIKQRLNSRRSQSRPNINNNKLRRIDIRSRPGNNALILTYYAVHSCILLAKRSAPDINKHDFTVRTTKRMPCYYSSKEHARKDGHKEPRQVTHYDNNLPDYPNPLQTTELITKSTGLLKEDNPYQATRLLLTTNDEVVTAYKLPFKMLNNLICFTNLCYRLNNSYRYGVGMALSLIHI